MRTATSAWEVPRWAAICPTRGVCSTCTGTCGNCVWIGTKARPPGVGSTRCGFGVVPRASGRELVPRPRQLLPLRVSHQRYPGPPGLPRRLSPLQDPAMKCPAGQRDLCPLRGSGKGTDSGRLVYGGPVSTPAGIGTGNPDGVESVPPGAGMRNWFVEDRLVAVETVPGTLKPETGRL